MQFLYPQFLYALSLLLIPIIIHLFEFRLFKKVYFPNVRFLQKIQQQSQSRNQIKKWLLLFSRLLFITALVLAFSQPYFPEDQPAAHGTDGRAISIYVDNSFSMTNEGEDAILLQTAMDKAEDVTQSFLPSDRFNLLTNDRQSRYGRLTNKNQILQWIPEIKESPRTALLSDVVEQQRNLMFDNNFNSGQAFIISDFQRSTTDLDQIEEDTSYSLTFIPLEGVNADNIYIDSAWFASPILQPGQSATMHVRIRNSGESPASGSVRLEINEQQQAIATYNAAAESHDDAELRFSLKGDGWKAGKVSVDDHPVTFDDDYYFAFYVEEKVRILSINNSNSNRYINSVYRTDDYFELNNTKPGEVDYNRLSEYQLIILNEAEQISSGLQSELLHFLQEGGNLLIIPATEEEYTNSYNPFLRTLGFAPFGSLNETDRAITRIDTDLPLLSGVFEDIPQQIGLPSVSQSFNISQHGSKAQSVMTLRDGQPLIEQVRYEGGNAFRSAVPFRSNWTSLPEEALFVPLMYRIALYAEAAPALAYTIGSDDLVAFQAGDMDRNQVYAFVNADQEFIPEQRFSRGRMTFFPGEELNEAGIYDIKPADGQDGSEFKVAMNYDRSESELKFYSKSELESFAEGKNIKIISGQTADLTGTIQAMEQGAHLWRYFIILALLFLLAEILIFKLL